MLSQAQQESGEFIVLNAGAYHSGYNQVPAFGRDVPAWLACVSVSW